MRGRGGLSPQPVGGGVTAPPPLPMLLLRLAITPYTLVNAPKALYNWDMKKVVGCALLALLFLCVIAPVARADTSAPSQQPGNYIQIGVFESAFADRPGLTPQDIDESPYITEQVMLSEIKNKKKSITLTIISISILIFIFISMRYFYIIRKRKSFKLLVNFLLIVISIFFIDIIFIRYSHKEIEASITTEYRPYIQELREKQNQKIKFPVMEEIFSTQPTKSSPPNNKNNDEPRNLEDRIKDFKRTIDSLLN